MSEINKKDNNIKQNNKNEVKEQQVSSSNTKKSNTDDKEINVEDKLKDTEEKLLRSLAEVENQRRRFEKEIKDAFEFGSFNFAKESLAILDNLERAKISMQTDEKLKDNNDLGKFLENITIIEKDLISIFERNKINKINSKGKKFDPNFHQAMSEIENNVVETGTILQEIQAGYMLGERLLRPALVGIAKNNEENEEKKEKISL